MLRKFRIYWLARWFQKYWQVNWDFAKLLAEQQLNRLEQERNAR